MFRPVVKSHRSMLAAMKGLVLDSSPLPQTAAGEGESKRYCPDPPGLDILATPAEILAAACGDCKKLSILAARRAIDAGARHVELCMTVSDDPEEHVFLRVDGKIIDPAVLAGMPVRQIGAYIAETVWQAPPGA